MCVLTAADLEILRRYDEKFAAMPADKREKIERAVGAAKRQAEARNAPDISAPALIPPLTPEQEAADLHRDRLRFRIQKRIERMYQKTAIRHPNCGRRGAIHLQRRHQLGGVEAMLYRTLCGRLDCPHCQRRRLAKILKRAATCILDAHGVQYLPRTAPLHVVETTWSKWRAIDKRARRERGDGLGRLRVRRDDDTVLLVCERPIAGSKPMPPHLAYDIVEAAIDRLHPKKHAYRQLGNFADKQKTEWKLVERTGAFVRFDEAKKLLADLGDKGRLFKTAELSGLVFRAESAEDANNLVARILSGDDPTGAVSNYCHNAITKTSGETWTADAGRTPFEEEPAIDYPGTVQWEPSQWALT